MRKRKLGTSDLEISEVGLGCMSLGTEKTKHCPFWMKRSSLASTIWTQRICMTGDATKKSSVMRSKTDAKILFWQQKRETVGMTGARAGIGTLQKLT